MFATGHKLLQFEVLRRLGAGGMGEVYLARDTSLARDVALKVLPATVAEDPTLKRRLQREAQSLAALNHPHVAQIYGIHESDGSCFLSLEYVPGEDLSSRIARGPMSIDDAVAICSKIAEGIDVAHRSGVVHRDLKPANIRFTPNHNIKILDFGLATLLPSPMATAQTVSIASQVPLSSTVDQPITRYGMILGTPAYMSPEQARGLPTDHRTDIWAFGCILYECLTGKQSFGGPTMADVLVAVLDHEPDWNALPFSQSSAVVTLLRHCLSKDIDDRIGSFSEVRHRLQHLDESLVDVTPGVIAQARRLCTAREWQAAFELLQNADASGGLDAHGLELLGECARWAGHYKAIVDPTERAHAGYVASGNLEAAVRTAFTLFHTHDDAGEQAIASAWWDRSEELIATLPEGPQHAWHAWFRNRICIGKGDIDGQYEAATEALDLARRFGEKNVEALAMIDLSHVASAKGDGAETLRLVQRATSLALGGEIDIFATGMVFCNAIWACRCRGEWQRAQQWTESSTRWVHRQHVNYFPGMCRVHRAEVLRVRGKLEAAEEECEAATEQVTGSMPAYATFPWSELGEVRRRRGDFEGAMEAFQRAITLGWDPQPGLSLLLMQQGEIQSAFDTIERALNEPRPTMIREDRTNLLTARATIAVAADRLDVAQAAVDELSETAARNQTPWDLANAAYASGMLELARGEPASAIDDLSRAHRHWVEMDTPFELATNRVLLARAFQTSGNSSRAKIELTAARDAFKSIGAGFDRERVENLLSSLGSTRSTSRTSAVNHASMTREGDMWVIGFGGRWLRLKHTRGLEYLSELLSQPGVDIWAIELAGNGAPTDRGDAGEILDVEARDAYRRRAEELQDELDRLDSDSHPTEVERIRTELDAIANQLAAAVGLGGRARRVGGAVERARQSVTKGVRGAIGRIAEMDQSLGRYLEVTIKTGTACRFESSLRESVEWEVKS